MQDSIYMSPWSHLIEVGLVVAGLLIMFLIFRTFGSRHAWGEGAEYEMLDLPMPDEAEATMTATSVQAADATASVATGEADEPDEAIGFMGLEDRIVRGGFSIALIYISITFFGVRSLAMWILLAPIVYFAVTCAVGRDPLYRMFGISTKFD